MRSATWFTLAGLLTSVSVAGQNTQNPTFVLPDSVRMLSDLTYAAPGAEALTLDLFSPRQGNGSVPGIVFVSCGGWITGSKSQFWRQGVYLATHGFISAATQCRLAPAARFPDQLNDTIAAVRWLRDHAKEHGVDPKRIAIAGASSGGYLAALVGSNLWNGSDWSGASPNARVQAAVVFNGVLDVSGFDTPSTVRTNLTNFLGAARDENPNLWLFASPLNHVSPAAAPVLLLHGTNDTTVPYSQSVAMQRRLRGAGVKAELFTAEGAGHGFFNQPPWYEPSIAAAAEFLHTVFR